MCIHITDQGLDTEYWCLQRHKLSARLGQFFLELAQGRRCGLQLREAQSRLYNKFVRAFWRSVRLLPLGSVSTSASECSRCIWRSLSSSKSRRIVSKILKQSSRRATLCSISSLFLESASTRELSFSSPVDSSSSRVAVN